MMVMINWHLFNTGANELSQFFFQTKPRKIKSGTIHKLFPYKKIFIFFTALFTHLRLIIHFTSVWQKKNVSKRDWVKATVEYIFCAHNSYSTVCWRVKTGIRFSSYRTQFSKRTQLALGSRLKHHINFHRRNF